MFEDVENFFLEEREENETLEFKSGSNELTDATFNTQLESKITRSIASFLNSSGGILIWGSPRERQIVGRKEKVCQGELNPLNVARTKDQLINKITWDISYLPIGINVKRLEREGQYLYIFEVTESESKPHQYKGNYPIRLDGQTQNAPHYLVDALFKQVKLPDIEGYLKFENISNFDNLLLVSLSVGLFNFSPLLNEKKVRYQLIATYGSFGDSGGIVTRNVEYLNYGRPQNRNFQWSIDSRELEVLEDITFVLAIDGEKCPSKTSRYKFSARALEKLGDFDYSKCLIDAEENKSLIESNLSKEGILKGYLNR